MLLQLPIASPLGGGSLGTPSTSPGKSFPLFFFFIFYFVHIAFPLSYSCFVFVDLFFCIYMCFIGVVTIWLSIRTL